MTGSRRSEQKSYEPRYSILFQSAIDSIVSLDREFRVILANPATEKTFGFPTSELVGSLVECLLPFPIRNRFYKILNSVAKLPDKKGKTFWADPFDSKRR